MLLIHFRAQLLKGKHKEGINVHGNMLHDIDMLGCESRTGTIRSQADIPPLDCPLHLEQSELVRAHTIVLIRLS